MSEEKIPVPESLEALIESVQRRNDPNVNLGYTISQYLENKARKYGFPLHGTFELTPLCNLNCKMCYVHLLPQQLGNHKPLSTDQWKNLMKDAVDAGMMYATLTGGECLAYPGFDELYLYLRDMGVRSTVLTNGVLMTEERVRFFEKYPPRGIQISLYGCCDDEYEKVTGVRAFEQVLEGIERLKRTNIPLGIAITPNRFMDEGGTKLLRFVESLGVYYTVNTSLFRPRIETGRSDMDIDLSEDDYIKLHKLRYELKGFSVSPCMMALPEPNGNGEEKKGLICSAGSSSFEISWQGKMMPCGMIQEIAEDVLVRSFGDCWNLIRTAVKEYPQPCECQGCAYYKFCPHCVVAHQTDAPKGHASKRFCDRIQRYVQEGLIQVSEKNEEG